MHLPLSKYSAMYVLLSLFHAESSGESTCYFVSFGSWWMASISVIRIVVHVQRVTGQIHRDTCVMSFLMTIVFPTSTEVNEISLQAYRCWLVYFGAVPNLVVLFCIAPFTIFCLGEYALITLNTAFWAMVIFEFSKMFDGVQV
ncbi:hypothetical protein PENTCL1PPCAC_21561, partial [Pristionchus entomophagus]